MRDMLIRMPRRLTARTQAGFAVMAMALSVLAACATGGKVEHPLSLSYDELRCMPRVTTKAVLNCGEIFTDSGTWSGVPIRYILEQAGVQAAATTVGLKSADGYLLLISMEDARDGQNFLAYEMEGKPLPILHGFPLRAVFPNHPGSRWVKWLVEIIVE